MKPPFVTELTPERATAFLAVKYCVMRLPLDIRLGKNEEGKNISLSPHILSRAIEDAFPGLRHMDGIYSNAVDHSWVVTEDGHIIDMMNDDIMSGPVMVRHSDPPSPTFKHYRALEEDEWESEHFRRYGHEFRTRSFRLAVVRVTRALKKIAKNHNEEFLKIEDKFTRAAKISELIAG